MRVCMCVRVKSQSQCRFNLQGYCIWLGKANQALLSRSIYPQCTQVNPMYGHQKSLLNMCVCTCVCACVCACAEIIYMISGVCVRVKSQSQCGFYLQVYWIWLKANQALLSRSIYPQCTQVMYGHSLLNNSTCVCVHMRVCVCVHMRVCMCARVKSQSQCGFNLQAYWIWHTE